MRRLRALRVKGAIYARESGNILDRIKITLPAGHTWRSFCRLLLASMPKKLAEHYEGKILVFLKWWQDNGYPDGIPDEAEADQEARKVAPSWRRIAKSLLRNDYWCKGQLGMEPDEVLRLKQIGGLADLFKDREFSEAWE